MRFSILLLLGAGLLTPTSGCLSITPQVLSTAGVRSYAEAVNARRGTDFPERMTLTGVGVGANVFGGIFGIESAFMKGAATSEDANGQALTLRVRVEDLKLLLAYPAKVAGSVVLAPGMDWLHRTTQVDGAEETAFVLRPKVMAILSVGKIAISPQLGYDLPVLVNDELGLNTGGGRPVKAGMSGLFGGVSLSYGCAC